MIITSNKRTFAQRFDACSYDLYPRPCPFLQITVGATEGLYVSLKALAGPGDEVRWNLDVARVIAPHTGMHQKGRETRPSALKPNSRSAPRIACVE